MASKVLDEIHLTKDGGIIKKIFTMGDDPTPEKG